MKNTFIILVLLILSNLTYSQGVRRTVTMTKIKPKTIYKNLYNLETGEKISKKEFKLLVKQNGQIQIGSYYNKFGKIERRYYNPNPIIGEKRNSLNKKLKKGELFPDFILKTINNEKIQLDDLKGKLIIISFGLVRNGVWINKREINEIKTKINGSSKPSEIEWLIFFRESKEKVVKIFDFESSNFKLIPDGTGFINKWNITRFPTMLLIDKEGRFINNFLWYKINITELLN